MTGGGSDAFIVKLNSTGSGVVFSTYLGGSYDDQASGVALDTAGNVYVTGTTSRSQLPDHGQRVPAAIVRCTRTTATQTPS